MVPVRRVVFVRLSVLTFWVAAVTIGATAQGPGCHVGAAADAGDPVAAIAAAAALGLRHAERRTPPGTTTTVPAPG